MSEPTTPSRRTWSANTGLLITVDYDHAARAQYQRMSDKPIVATVQRSDGAIVDLARDGSVVGVEWLNGPAGGAPRDG